MPKITTISAGKRFEWDFGADGSIRQDDKSLQVDIQKLSQNKASVLFHGKSYDITLHRNDFRYWVLINEKFLYIDIETSTKKNRNFLLNPSQRQSSGIEVRSPMPGMVVRCEVETGANVKIGDGLFILEAMKMENEIRATKEGVVKKVLVTDRQTVEKGQLLLLIQ